MIETCCLPRILRIGGKSYSLAPPTVRQAVEILHLMENIKDEDDVLLLIDQICRLDFSPSMKLQRVVLLNMLKNNPVNFRLSINKALLQGYDPKKIEKSLEELKSTERKKTDWGGLIESYRSAYGGSRWEVYNTVPFTFFMEGFKTILKDRANQSLRKSVICNPGEKAIKAWQRNAKGGSTEYGPVVSATPEEVAKSKALDKNKNVNS